MPSGVSLVGKKFGRLTVLEETSIQDIYLCECSCDNTLEVWRSCLTKGTIRHCGCLWPASRRARWPGTQDTPHAGHTRSYMRKDGNWRAKFSSEYLSWKGMRERCYLKTCIGFETHGAHGVTVCDRWLGKGGFRNFLADMGPRPVGMTLDRKNPFGNYEPGNCRWADSDIQNLNKRVNYEQEFDEPEKVILSEEEVLEMWGSVA